MPEEGEKQVVPRGTLPGKQASHLVTTRPKAQPLRLWRSFISSPFIIIFFSFFTLLFTDPQYKQKNKLYILTLS
jgi:hypothetical protein